MKCKITAVLLLVFVIGNCFLTMTPVFAATGSQASAKSQANAYHKHSIGLTGVKNARELGGYRTRDGRTVKLGKLLHSAELSGMTKADRKKPVSKYHVASVIDFRTDDTVRTYPDPVLKGVAYVRCPHGPDFVRIFTSEDSIAKEFLDDAKKGKFDRSLVETYFRENYNQMYLTESGIDMFRGFFDELLKADGKAVLWHCSSGKDQTGNTAALLLYVLGVDRETIIEDYMLTNDYLKEDIQDIYDTTYRLTGSKATAKEISKAQGVERSWILQSFKTMEQHYGSVDQFLKKKVGLTQKDIQKLRTAYLK